MLVQNQIQTLVIYVVTVMNQIKIVNFYRYSYYFNRISMLELCAIIL